MADPEAKERIGFDEFEARQKLSGFFALLLEIDKRNNPHLYSKKFDEQTNEDNRG